MRHDDVRHWVERYEEVWRTPGTEHLRELFTDDATYLVSPWASPIVGLPAIEEFWDAGRVSPDEAFDLASEVLAVDGATAVVRVAVDYTTTGNRWRDLWLLTYADDGRCAAFEEWPFAPGQPDGQDLGD